MKRFAIALALAAAFALGAVFMRRAHPSAEEIKRRAEQARLDVEAIDRTADVADAAVCDIYSVWAKRQEASPESTQKADDARRIAMSAELVRFEIRLIQEIARTGRAK